MSTLKKTTAIFCVYKSVKKAIQDIASPGIKGLKGQIQVVHSEIRMD